MEGANEVSSFFCTIPCSTHLRGKTKFLICPIIL